MPKRRRHLANPSKLLVYVQYVYNRSDILSRVGRCRSAVSVGASIIEGSKGTGQLSHKTIHRSLFNMENTDPQILPAGITTATEAMLQPKFMEVKVAVLQSLCPSCLQSFTSHRDFPSFTVWEGELISSSLEF